MPLGRDRGIPSCTRLRSHEWPGEDPAILPPLCRGQRQRHAAQHRVRIHNPGTVPPTGGPGTHGIPLGTPLLQCCSAGLLISCLPALFPPQQGRQPPSVHPSLLPPAILAPASKAKPAKGARLITRLGPLIFLSLPSQSLSVRFPVPSLFPSATSTTSAGTRHRGAGSVQRKRRKYQRVKKGLERQRNEDNDVDRTASPGFHRPTS